MAAVKSIPDGYHSVQPYLYIRGAAQALEFYKSAFGATERMRMPRPDGKIMHAEIVLGDSCIMLADENSEHQSLSPKHYGGSACGLMLYVPDCDALYHQALAAGAVSLREPKDEFYGDRMAHVEDPFGFRWFIGTHVRDVSTDEMMAAMKPD